MELVDLLGDYQAFFQQQKARLLENGMAIDGCSISHMAFRTSTYKDYLGVRDGLEKFCVANVENVWNGRPISKLLLGTPLDLGDSFSVSLIELIPPFHQSVYMMGLEHVGVVIGDTVDEFSLRHRAELTGQQFQSRFCAPYFVRFDDYTHVKFYRYSLMDVCVMEGRPFDGFYHVDDWVAE